MAHKQTCPKCDRVFRNRRQLKVHVTYCVVRPALSQDQRKFLADRLLRASMYSLNPFTIVSAWFTPNDSWWDI